MPLGCGDSASPTPPASDAGRDTEGADTAPDAVEDAPPDLPPGDPGLVLGVPETERWVLPTLDAPVHIVRSRGYVPHIYASNRHDLGVALGFTVARDRLFVMDLQRRLAQGRVSQLMGDLALGADIEARQLGMAYVAERLFDNLAEEDAAFIDAYVEGVNRYIELAQAGELEAPSEIGLAALLLGYSNPADALEPFTRFDVAAMVVVIMYETTFDGGDPGRQRAWDTLQAGIFSDDAALGELRSAGVTADIWERLEPFFPVSSTPGFGIHGAEKAGVPVAALAPRSRGQIPAALSTRVTDRLEKISHRFGRREVDNFGSNCWAVHGDFAEDGFALAAGDGHLPLYVPSIMWQIGLDTMVFGDDNLRQAGLLIQSLPVLGVGTNGHVAWSQVNPVADTTDWYREEIELGPGGLPARSRFGEEWRALTRIDEEYVVADAPALGSVGRTEVIPRWTTFDGRLLFDVEGRALGDDEQPEDGEGIVRFSDRRIVPGDLDDDGVITGVSFDYAALDATQYIGVVSGFADAQTVHDYQEMTKGLVGNMLYAAVADQNGDILFTAFQGVPCRSYLPRGEDGQWLPGANPTQLLDGTTYRGFELPTDDNGRIDESLGAGDPYKCVVPFDATPQSISPAEGFVLNANNQPAPIFNDGSAQDDPWYIGGPWSSVRADSIQQGLQEAVADRAASIEDMATIQTDQRSRLGEIFVPPLVAAAMLARDLRGVDRILDPWEDRLVATYSANEARIDEAAGDRKSVV
jgi:penicillin amidase